MSWWTNLWASLAVLAVLATVSYGLPAVDRAVPDGRTIPRNTKIVVGYGVSIVAPSGAVLDSAETSANRGKLVFEVRGARYTISASPYTGRLGEAAARLRERISELPGQQLAGRSYHVVTDQRVMGLEGRFDSAGRNGYFAVFVHDGRVAEVVAHGVGLALSGSLRAVRRSVATIRFGSVEP